MYYITNKKTGFLLLAIVANTKMAMKNVYSMEIENLHSLWQSGSGSGSNIWREVSVHLNSSDWDLDEGFRMVFVAGENYKTINLPFIAVDKTRFTPGLYLDCVTGKRLLCFYLNSIERCSSKCDS